MEWGFGFFLGVAAGLGLSRVLMRKEGGASPFSLKGLTGDHEAAAAPAGDATLGADDASRPLSQRLRTFHETLESVGRDAAHTDELASHPDFARAVALFADPETPKALVSDYAFGGSSWTLSCAAFAALAQREDGASLVAETLDMMGSLSAWQIKFALDYLKRADPSLAPGAPMIAAREWWPENVPMRRFFTDHFETYGDDGPASFGTGITAVPSAQKQVIRSFLERIRHPLAKRLADELSGGEGDAPSQVLAGFGRFWNVGRAGANLIEPEAWTEALDAAGRLLSRDPPRSLLVSGETSSGKTAFLKLLSLRVHEQGWRVFEASAADLQAGQQFIGQLEARLRQALDELVPERKLVWYVPDLLACAMSGTHQGQSASILDQMMPALASGRVVIWTEATPAQLARLIQIKPGLRRLLEMARLEALSEEETMAVAGRLADVLSSPPALQADASFARTAVDAANHYLTASSLPGAALALMKVTAQRVSKSKQTTLSGHDVLETLSQMTGLPLSLLDGGETLDLAGVTAFFAARVIGQDDAVAAIVERIAMLKAALNDPGKPIGVFLFAGPTGTGKTELAKAAADYLFGSAERMVRLDMSEYQTYEAAAKIMGGPGMPPDADTLVNRIRKQPFSLVLLDEFEKAHPQIWDLFLQVFDEGRLTDAFGQTADFRHCLIILTSNLGATAHKSSGNSIGFAPSAAAYADEQVMRAISQTFRPEFQNRLDKVLVFRPLTRDLMRSILRKELARVFERRGLKDREWAVEWDASAIEFLLEKGFSPEMGARPLKRAIDQHLVAPLAGLIVERRFPEGDQFVFIRRHGAALKAEFVDPGLDGDGLRAETMPAIAAGDGPSVLEMMRSPEAVPQHIAALGLAINALQRRIGDEAWEDEKAGLADEINTIDFWSRADRFETLERLGLMDRLQVALETAQSLFARLERTKPTATRAMRDLVGRVAMQVHLVEEGLRDLDEKAPVEAALLVEPLFHSPGEEGKAERAWCQTVRGMYQAWAEKRNMALSEVTGIGGADGPVLLIAGFGAARALAREVGLHIQDGIEAESTTSRMTARVVAVTLPLNVPKAQLRTRLEAALREAPRPTTIVRRYRLGASPLVRSGDGTVRSGKVEDVLAGGFDVLGA